MSSTAQSLSRLLIAERASLLRLAGRIVGSLSAAEDVAQLLWLKIQKVEDHPPIKNKRAYLYRLVSNLAIDQVRAAKRRDALFETGGEAADDIASAQPSPEATIIDQQRLRLLDAAIQTLPERCREVFILVRVQGNSVPYAARELAITDDMVRKHLRHALRVCHAALYSDQND